MTESPINICYNECPSRPTKLEKERQIICYWLKQISPPIEPFCFDMPIKNIFEAQPDQLRKVIVKNNSTESEYLIMISNFLTIIKVGCVESRPSSKSFSTIRSTSTEFLFSLFTC